MFVYLDEYELATFVYQVLVDLNVLRLATSKNWGGGVGRGVRTFCFLYPALSLPIYLYLPTPAPVCLVPIHVIKLGDSKHILVIAIQFLHIFFPFLGFFL